ncbi:hypothetical protein BC829DRAFT_443776 [Chytridium lagenaria]|nr:hypothetical protein BC829DRAFT_443776 [Chytridium lagenaria]
MRSLSGGCAELLRDWGRMMKLGWGSAGALAFGVKIDGSEDADDAVQRLLKGGWDGDLRLTLGSLCCGRRRRTTPLCHLKKKASPNKLIVDDATNDDNSVCTLSTATYGDSPAV